MDGTETLLNREQVQAALGLSRSTIYRMINAGLFPAPLSISPRRKAWRSSDINRWITDRDASSEADGVEGC